MVKNKYFGAWITTNRSCNLRCKWCYAYGTGFSNKDDIDYSLAISIVDFCATLGVKRIILIGGEPTIYNRIIDLIKYIHSKQITCIVVSNGIVFENIDICKRFIDAGVDTFSISVKSNDKDEYIQTTGFDCFEKVLKAISNLSELNANFSVSQVLTKENIPTFAKGIELFKNAGAKRFSFGFCYNFNCNSVESDYLKNNNPYILAYLFKKYYDEINNSLEGCSYSLSQGLPLCVWDSDVVDRMNSRNQIHSICQLLGGGGILFDTDGSLIPCNSMYNLKYGKIGKDFNDIKSFNDFMKTEPVVELFETLRGMPNEKCENCDIASKCGGGCVTNWTNYSFNQLENDLKQEFDIYKKNK